MQQLLDVDKWTAPRLPERIPGGDMPADKISVTSECVRKANILFPELIRQLKPILESDQSQRAVVSVCGGSGVGKSSIASILSFYLNLVGVGCYTLSGDNYPHRIPMYNDAERLRIYRYHGLHGMIDEGKYSEEHFNKIQKWQVEESDADPGHLEENPWFDSYIRAGRKGLEQYLGTEKEINFEEVGRITKAFHDGQERIWLKRMGRTEAALWYEQVDFRNVRVLILEWTHGNSDHFQGVDIPILLSSTHQETLAHRIARNRDGNADSPFTTMVLEIEQNQIMKQSHKAKIIMAKSGELLTLDGYRKEMYEEEV